MILAKEVREEVRTAQHEWRKIVFGVRDGDGKGGFQRGKKGVSHYS